MNNTISDAQLAANRANATHSTGPRSSTGKRIVSLNAVKTGLTGNTVMLPFEDAVRYRAHIEEYAAEFQPVGIQERDLVQSIADLRWRLNRIPGLEAYLNSHALTLCANAYPDRPEAEASFLVEVAVFNMNEKKLHNIHLHEARLARRREKELAELRALQQERKAREAEARKKEEEAKKAAAAQPQPPAEVKTAAASSQNGFEFTNEAATPANPSTPTANTPEVVKKTAA